MKKLLLLCHKKGAASWGGVYNCACAVGHDQHRPQVNSSSWKLHLLHQLFFTFYKTILKQ